MCMKRFLALIFLFLYLYNIAGYLAVFSVLQYRVRDEMKRMLKATVQEGELIKLAFHEPSLEKGLYSIQWITDDEFRFNGSMYDILRSDTSADTVYFVCINDVQEEQLFSHLDSHVQRHMGDTGQAGKLDLFKDVFKDSHIKYFVPSASLPFTGVVVDLSHLDYLSIDLDVPFLPPRIG